MHASRFPVAAFLVGSFRGVGFDVEVMEGGEEVVAAVVEVGGAVVLGALAR